MSKFSEKADGYAQGIRETMLSLGPRISETVKGKLSLGARILQAGGIKKVFKRHFSVGKREKLLKASQCYLSTTSGPIAGLLFILHFSERRIDQNTIQGSDAIEKDKESKNSSENVNRPNQKYIQIVTVEEFEFWFMGFVSYQRSFRYLQQLVSESEMRP